MCTNALFCLKITMSLQSKKLPDTATQNFKLIQIGENSPIMNTRHTIHLPR